ncbi:Mu transposase C-terminal domain-containing protein [Micropruina glycogenica]|uniref:Mu transposase C-terminal domain-containing protein n=1 Tax=Micropruina glycogenica TaxID=75385 RepID=UPI000CF67A38|nr:Mu transposase C-terminal domain-containing protein [Micropruina glycogenica]
MSFAVDLSVGDQVLTDLGLARIDAIERHGVAATGPCGQVRIAYTELAVRGVEASGAQAVHQPMTAWWDALDEQVRNTTLSKLAIVLEIKTGYRSGWSNDSTAGEPFHPFGPAFKVSLHQQAIAMAAQLAMREQASPHELSGSSGGQEGRSTVTPRAIEKWVKAYEAQGLRGLVDGRSTRNRKGFDDLDARFRAIVDEVVAPFDGTASAVNLEELRRRTWLKMTEQGLERSIVPERLSLEYISWRYNTRGSRPRAHRSAAVRKRSAHKPSLVVHPSHVAIDSTRADNLVWDELRQTPYSVEITAIISVSTRVILALRVTPRSANGVEAGLCLYDAMRPLSMKVEGATADHWRWAGIPKSLESPLFTARQDVSRPLDTLQGTHQVPGLRPTSIRSDHGSIFMSAHFKELLRNFGISLWSSRVGASTDNAYIERFWETIQSALQAVEGYKGRNVSERGRKVIQANQPLMTAFELETHLRRYVALQYHLTPHRGLHIPGLETHKVTPLEYFDFAMEACGDISVPQHPDLIFDFLPIRWLTIRHAGVEFKGLSYDSPVLDQYRHVRRGTFRPDDSAAPFFYDPRDVTRIWFRDPDKGRVSEVPCRQAHLFLAPLTARIRDKAIAAIAARDGGKKLRRHTATELIIDELGALHQGSPSKDWNATMTAERLRFETSQRDHAEVLEAWRRVDPALPRISAAEPESEFEPWPDLAADN